VYDVTCKPSFCIILCTFFLFTLIPSFRRIACIRRYPKSLCSPCIARIFSSNSLLGSILSKRFCQYMYVALGKPITARMSFSLNSPRRLWMILAVFSEEFPLLSAASSVLLKMHSRFLILTARPQVLLHA